MAMTLRLTDEQAEALRETAKREGRSMHEVAVLAITDYTSRRARKRDESLARILEEDREVIDRLGSA
jgi:predicted transcriptional regulator